MALSLATIMVNHVLMFSHNRLVGLFAQERLGWGGGEALGQPQHLPGPDCSDPYTLVLPALKD